MLKKIFLFTLFINISFIALTKDFSRRNVIKKIDSIRPFKVFFTSKVIDGDEIITTETGYIVYSDESHIKWVYAEPDYKVWILKGRKYEFYEKDEMQLTRGSLKDTERIWLWKLLHSKKGDSVKIDKKKRIIILKNRNTDSEFIIIFNKKFLPVKVVQSDPTGVNIEYKFYNYKFKYVILEKDFNINPEKGTDIIDIE